MIWNAPAPYATVAANELEVCREPTQVVDNATASA